MTIGFQPAPGGGVTVALDRDEVAALRGMAALILDLVRPPAQTDEFAALVGIGSSSERPDDPVLARLFPDAYPEDREAAGEFRRYTEDELRRHKRENAETMARTLPESDGVVTLDLADAHAWLKALNDIRLSLGTRLGVDEDSSESYPEEAPGGGPHAPALRIYHWLGGLQETLVTALFRPLPDEE